MRKRTAAWAVTLDGERATGESYTIAHHLYTADGECKIMIASLRYLQARETQLTDWPPAWITAPGGPVRVHRGEGPAGFGPQGADDALRGLVVDKQEC